MHLPIFTRDPRFHHQGDLTREHQIEEVAGRAHRREHARHHDVGVDNPPQSPQCQLTPRKADYLIAGDKDLLADRHPIVTPASFRARHGG